MYARSVMLVRRDVMRLERDGVETVQMQHDAENDTSGLVWKATLAGPAGSVWEGAAFQLRLCFPANYDAEPPQVAFTTIPFHPNIDPQTGRPCIDFLDTPGRWQPGTDLQAVLYTLQTLLAEPALEQPVFPEAAAMLTDDPERFRAIARECVLATQRVQAGLPPYDDIDPNPNPFSQAEASSRTKVHTIPEQQQQRPTASAKQVPFETYFADWARIGASKAAPPRRPPPPLKKEPRPASMLSTLGGVGDGGGLLSDEDEADDLLRWTATLSPTLD